MNPNSPTDSEAFGDLWEVAAEVLGSRALSDAALKMTFEGLGSFDIEEVDAAVRAHCSTPGVQFVPKIGDVVQLIEGQLPSDDGLIALAHAAGGDQATPLGRVVRLMLGSDLQSLHPKALVHRVAARRAEVVDLHRRALVGDYTDREIRMLVGAGLDPAGALGPETAGPRLPFRADVVRRATEAREQLKLGADKSKPPAGRTHAAHRAGQAALAEMMSTLGMTGGPTVGAEDTEAQRIARRARAAEYRAAGERVVEDWQAEHGQAYSAPRPRYSRAEAESPR